jgi:hypothetical protein
MYSTVLARHFYFGVRVPILREGYHLVALPIEEKFPFTECPFLSSFYYNRYIPMIVLCSENYKVVALCVSQDTGHRPVTVST